MSAETGKALSVFLIAALMLVGCDGTIRRVDSPPPPPPGLGSVQIVSNIPDAEIYIDGRYQGILSGYREGFVGIERGLRRIEVRRAGYYTHYALVQIDESPVRIDVNLVRTPRFDDELPASKNQPSRLN